MRFARLALVDIAPHGTEEANTANSNSATSSPMSQTEHPLDQAAILQHLAHNGDHNANANANANESNMFGYATMRLDQSNGGTPSQQEYIFSDAYPLAGLSNGFQDLEDDPAALLESLASFDRPASSHESHTIGSNHHFANLLEAAATAGGAEAARENPSIRADERESGIAGRSISPGYFKRTFDPNAQAPKRGHDEERRNDQSGNKRRKKTPPRQEQEPEELEHEIWGSEAGEESVEDETFPTLHTPITLPELKAAGIHSAAALFRRPTAAAKKYHRPQMSKLFTSLEIDPEAFIHLQAAAKAYMLDDSYPERRECIGSKGSKETDLIKLKLFSCVKSFLEDEGWGEVIFGAQVQSSIQNRKLIWPQMSNKIITLVTPLLRRMVTNERQRQYASSTRGGKKAPKGGKKGDRAAGSRSPCSPGENHNSERSASPAHNNLDPQLDRHHYNIGSSFLPGDGNENTLQQGGGAPTIDLTLEDDESGLKYYLNILHDSHRLKPRITLNPTTCPGFSSLVQHAHNIVDDSSQKLVSVKILGPVGLVDIKDEDSWREAIDSIKKEEWMDGEVKCVVGVVSGF